MKRRWLVCVGGEANAVNAKVLSKHSTKELAEARVYYYQGLYSYNGIPCKEAYVTHAMTLEAAIAGGTEAVQALAGKEYV
jgi:hypothetical protein